MPATVSIIVPVHDASSTIRRALERLALADLGPHDLHREIVVVDDASTDGSSDYVLAAASAGAVRACVHPEHLGQGAALSTGLAMATGQFIVVADPTLAYDPDECGRLLAPILSGEADVVYGSRYVAATRQVPRLWDRLAHQILTAVSNGFTNVALSDATTSFQAFRADVVRGAVFRADGPAIAGELAALFTTRHCRIFEVPVSHRTPAATASGMRWMEGLSHLTMMARCRFRDWQLRPVAPHHAHRSPVMAAPRAARLTRLVRPIDLMPMSPSERPTL